MKKNITILLEFCAVGVSYAATLAPTSQLTTDALMRAATSAQSPLQSLSPTILEKSTTVSSGHKAPEASEIIYEAPAGRHVIMNCESMSTFPFFGSIYQSPDIAVAKDVVFGDDGYIYIKNILSGIATDTWIKGLLWGERVYFTFPQPVLNDPTYGVSSIYKLVYKEWEEEGQTHATYEPDVTQSIFFTYKDGKLIMQDDCMIGLCLDVEDSEGQTTVGWGGYGEQVMYMEEFDGVPQSVPEGINTESFVFFWDNFGSSVGCYLKGVITDTDVYIADLFGNGEGVLHGTIDGDIVTFKSNQYLGIYSNHLTYFMPGHYDLDESSESYGQMIHDEEMKFVLDREAASLEQKDPKQYILLNAGNEQVYYTQSFTGCKFAKGSVPATATPAAPIQLCPEAQSDPEIPFTYFLSYVLPVVSVDEELLPTDRLLYTVFADGKPVKWASLDDSQYIPYDTTVEKEIYAHGDFHFLYLTDPYIDIIGMQQFYVTDDGELMPSEMTQVYADGSGDADVESIEADNEIESIEYFGIDGMRYEKMQKGLNIIRVTYTNGNSVTMKHMIR